MAELYPVTFHGDTIFCVEHDEQPYTPVRPIIENMGLDWASQSVKLNASKERWGVVIIATPSNGGEQRMICIPVRKLPAFLASIKTNKVAGRFRSVTWHVLSGGKKAVRNVPAYGISST